MELPMVAIALLMLGVAIIIAVLCIKTRHNFKIKRYGNQALLKLEAGTSEPHIKTQTSQAKVS